MVPSQGELEDLAVCSNKLRHETLCTLFDTLKV